MSESCVVEVYEYQTYSSSGWKPYRELPWALKANNQLCKPPDEIKPPSSEWVWTTNWRIDKLTGKTDRDGWEYATRIYRLKSTSETNRKSKAEQSFFDTARRRVWARILRRETVMKSMEIDKALPKIQMGLTSINTARKKIESIMKQSADAIDNEHFQSLIKSVRKNIVDIKSAIQQLENNEKNSSTNNPNAHAIFKKLKNDLTKEETAIETAIDPSREKPNKYFSPIRKTFSGRNAELENESENQKNRATISVANSNGGSANNSNNGRIPRGSFADIPITGSTQNEYYGSYGNSNANSNSNGYGNTIQNEYKDNSTVDPTHIFPELDSVSVTNKKNGVKGGSAGSFNPNVRSRASMERTFGGSSAGNFQDERELQIAQKFIAIDEATLMQELVEERDVEIKKINAGIAQIHEMFVDLSKIVEQQQVEIDSIYTNTEETHAKTQEAFNNIVEASRIQKSTQCVIS